MARLVVQVRSCAYECGCRDVTTSLALFYARHASTLLPSTAPLRPGTLAHACLALACQCNEENDSAVRAASRTTAQCMRMLAAHLVSQKVMFLGVDAAESVHALAMRYAACSTLFRSSAALGVQYSDDMRLVLWDICNDIACTRVVDMHGAAVSAVLAVCILARRLGAGGVLEWASMLVDPQKVALAFTQYRSEMAVLASASLS